MNLLEKKIEILNNRLQGSRGRGSKFLRKKSSVLMLSGGIDAVAVLKYVLVETDKLLYVHHIHLKNDEGIEYSIYKKEAEAVRKIVPYMKKTFRNFNYTESTIDVRQIVGLLPDYYEEKDFSLSNLGYVSDRLWWGLIAGLMSRITNSNEFYIGTCVEDGTEISFADGHSQTNVSIETIADEGKSNTQNDNGLIYVFIAFLITWIGFFFYLYYLSQKRRELEREINSIKQKLTAK